MDLAAVELDWIEKQYPDALQILDFYHAMQYAWDFAKVALADPLHQKSWTDAADVARSRTFC